MTDRFQSNDDFFVGLSVSSFNQTPFPYGRVGELFQLKKTELKIILYLYHLANINKHRPIAISGRKLAARIGGHRNSVIKALNTLSAPVLNIGSGKTQWVTKINQARSVYKLKITHAPPTTSNDMLTPEFFGIHPSLFQLMESSKPEVHTSSQDARMTRLGAMDRDSILSIVLLSILRYQNPEKNYRFSTNEFISGLSVGEVNLPPLPVRQGAMGIKKTDNILRELVARSLISFDEGTCLFSPFPPDNISKNVPDVSENVPDLSKNVQYNCRVEYGKTLLYSTQMLATNNGWLSIEDKYGVKTDVSLESVLTGIADRSNPRNYSAYIAGMHKKASIGIVVNPAKDIEPAFKGLDITSFVNHFLAERHSTIDMLSRRVFQALYNGEAVCIHSDGTNYPLKKSKQNDFVIVSFETGERELSLANWLATLTEPYLHSTKKKDVERVDATASLIERLGSMQEPATPATYLNIGGKGAVKGLIELKNGKLRFVADDVENDIDTEVALLANYTWEQEG